MLSAGAEQDERKRFIKYPIATATINTSKNLLVFGGTWIDNIRYHNGEKEAHIHLKLLRSHKHLAYPFFKEFLQSINQTYDSIYTEWGPRNPEDNPTNFLQDWGFEVKKNLQYSQVILKLNR